MLVETSLLSSGKFKYEMRVRILNFGGYDYNSNVDTNICLDRRIAREDYGVSCMSITQLEEVIDDIQQIGGETTIMPVLK